MTALLESLGIHNRAGVEAFIERLVEMLDDLDGDPDFEDSHDAEAINEDGGDVCDEPHDGDELEPLLSSPETCGQGVHISAPWQERVAAFCPGGMMEGWSGYDPEAAE